METTIEQVLHPDSTIEVLREDLRLKTEALQAMTDKYNAYVIRVARDCELLSNELITQANDRGWCEVYDQIVANLNSDMHHVQITPRVQEYEVELEVRATIVFTRTIEVRATDEDDALDRARNNMGDYVMLDEAADAALSNNGWDDVDVLDMRV